MILPSKHLSQDRALLTVGAKILQHLSEPKTISALWQNLPQNIAGSKNVPPLRYDSFVLALDLLFLLGSIELRGGLLIRNTP